jgi:AbrB family looped-hinge helix DNA binding protein
VEETEIQRRFTTTIPKRIRERLGLKEGMELAWDVEDGRIVLYPLSYRTLDGILKGKVDYTRKAKEEAESVFLGTKR